MYSLYLHPSLIPPFALVQYLCIDMSYRWVGMNYLFPSRTKRLALWALGSSLLERRRQLRREG